MELNPAQFRLLLVGPRVSRLLPFFQARGFVVDACTEGSQAMALMQQAPRHVLLLELELEDMLCADLLAQARAKNLAGSFILLEDPMKSGLIVSTLVRGVDGYVATPPDEAYLFRVVERQLLAQWALAQGSADAKNNEDKARAERMLTQERSKVTEFVKEIASLREELAKAKKVPLTTPEPLANAKTATRPKAATNATDDRTSPTGFDPPAELRAGPGARNTGFDDDPLTSPGNPTEPVRVKHPTGPTELDKNKGADDDLFLNLDDATGNIATAAEDDDDLLNIDD